MRFVAEIQSSFHIQCARVGDIDAARAYIIKIGNQSRKCTHRARWRETGRVSYRVHESVQMISRANGSVEVETHKITGWRAYAITQTRVRARVCLNSSFFFREKGNKIWSWRFRDTKFPAWTQRYRATDSLPPTSTILLSPCGLCKAFAWIPSKERSENPLEYRFADRKELTGLSPEIFADVRREISREIPLYTLCIDGGRVKCRVHSLSDEICC